MYGKVLEMLPSQQHDIEAVTVSAKLVVLRASEHHNMADKDVHANLQHVSKLLAAIVEKHHCDVSSALESAALKPIVERCAFFLRIGEGNDMKTESEVLAVEFKSCQQKMADDTIAAHHVRNSIIYKWLRPPVLITEIKERLANYRARSASNAHHMKATPHKNGSRHSSSSTKKDIAMEQALSMFK